jgi:gliding motility-associated-like protein
MNINPPTYKPNAVPPNVTIWLEDIATGNTIHSFSTGDIPRTSSPIWIPYEFAFTNPVNVSNVRVHIIDNVNTILTQGNDLAIDDIEVSMCTPAVEVTSEDTVCVGSTATFTGIFVNNGTFLEPLAYQWLKSATPETDKSSNWINIGNDSPVLTINNVLRSDSGYYRLAVSSANTIDNESCRAMSDPVYMAVKPCQVYDTLYQTICANEPYDFNGTLYDTTGAYNDTLQTVVTGLDSIITLILTVNPLNERTINATICTTESYDFYGDILTTTGIYETTIAGTECDTAVTLILTVNPFNEKTIIKSICINESYDFYGNILTTTGVYEATIAGTECDSIITLILTVNPFNEKTIIKSICTNESYNFYGNILTTTGTYEATIAGTECDSIITLILTVNPLNEKTINATICANESYNFYGNILTTTGTYETTIAGTECDSIITLILTVNPLNKKTINATICANESYNFYGNILTTAGTYEDTIVGTECDTAVTLILTVNPLNERTITKSICANESYNFYGNILTTTGIYKTTIAGTECDSIITLILTVNPLNERTINTTICANESYDFYGDILTTTGTYQATIAGPECDTAVTLNLTVLSLVNTEITEEICWGDSILFAGKYFYKSGKYNDTLSNVFGCDSLVSLNLQVPEIEVKIHSSNLDFCDTYETVLTAITPNSNIQWNTGATTPEIIVTHPGTYTVTVSEQDCELSESAHIIIEPCPILIVFPNAITPSKTDGINEYFYLPITNGIKELSITIYNRWGNAVFSSNDLHFRWDGKINGQITPDVYSYACSLLTIDGERRYMKGVVVVL